MGHGYLVVGERCDLGVEWFPQTLLPRVGSEKGWAQRQIWESKVYSIDLTRERWVWDTGLVCQGQRELGGWAYRADEV